MSTAPQATLRLRAPARYETCVGVCDVWSVDLTVATRDDEAYVALSPVELAHAARLPADAAARYIRTRFALRSILGAAAGIESADVVFATGPRGKPHALAACADLEFSVSRAGDLALIAVTPHVPLGVDIAQRQNVPEAQTIVRQYVPGARLPDRGLVPFMTAFLTWWVSTEAVAKACGAGLAATLGTFTLERAGPWLATDREIEGIRWQATALDVGSDHVAALATPTGALLERCQMEFPC